jgi:two-component system, NtrC family, sensor histidine kinase HydH
LTKRGLSVRLNQFSGAGVHEENRAVAALINGPNALVIPKPILFFMSIFPLSRIRWLRAYALAGLLVLISVIHYIAGGASAGMLHSLLGHLYIVPIILGAYWYGIRGGVSVSIASAVLFSPHLFLHWHDPFLDVYNFVELFLFLLIGGVTGVMSQMERNQRLRHEEAMKRLDESHRKLREQTDVLFQTEEQLRRADRLSALGELSAGMAHEIRNPLGSIKGAVEILKDDYEPQDAKYEFIRILLKETDRLNCIVQEFLGFARPKKPEYEQTDVNESLEAVLTLTAQEARKAGITVEKRFDRTIGKRGLDGGLLKQAFLNLVLNAIQAMPQGGVLTVESGLRDGAIVVAVGDTGAGISEENRRKLFSPFFTTKKNGTGLGLAITYRIIENHRGRIDVQSEPGKGTTFTVKIPIL